MNTSTLFTTFPVLETERLVLRRLTPEDAELFHAYYRDPAMTEHLDWSGPATVEQAREVIEAWNAQFAEKRTLPWGIALKSNNRLIGTLVYIPIRGTFEDTPLPPTTVGFELAAPWWGQGLMTEALRAVVAFAFRTMGAHRIQAEVFPGNTASRRLLHKLGFREEGVLKQYLYHEDKLRYEDIVLLALLKEDAEAE